ncbi:hypothetical protein JI739_21820 [Ramlibacter sp. AW1]|uniref:Ku domain-containing protein n=1 Tax=Ramlibacter aurantiacus TaxID=2801330 RepID=A0A937D5R7_9BURK|nr:Ku protein [Ramlibacter aurantiacus]MBL0422990.1 hypothetical protein [Ramlibacter aurantiacus]
MTARAIWKGRILLGPHEVPVKMYSAVEDQAVHFKLLSRQGQAPVHQRIVRKDTGTEVPREEQRKAFPIDGDRAVILQPDELESLVPPASREIHLCRFVPAGLLADPWFDRPYWLGPDEDADQPYFALARAVARQQVHGIARWVMRKKRYLGALLASGDHLALVTLRRSEQVLAMPAIEPARSRAPSEAELKLAMQLVESISGEFEPQAWPNEHRERLRALVAAKAQGDKVKPFKPRERASGTDLADALRASLAAHRERRVA